MSGIDDKNINELENNQADASADLTGENADASSSENAEILPQGEPSETDGENKKGKKSKKEKRAKRSKKQSEDENLPEADGEYDEDYNPKEKERLNPAIKRTAILFVASLLVFVLSFGCEYIFTNIIKPHNDTEIINWLFVTGKSDEAVNNAETYNQAEKSNLISKPLGDRYVHCVYNLDESSQIRTLKLVTEHSPIKVILDGDTIFDNGYGTRSIVGNSYNEIFLPESASSQKLELFIYYPMGFNLKADLSTPVNSNFFSADNFMDNVGLFIGGVIILLGVALAVLVFASMIRSRDIVVLLRLSATMILMGFVLFFTEMTTHSAVFTSSLWFSAINTLSALLTCLTVINVHSLMIDKKRITVILSFLAPIFSLLIWVPNITVMRTGMILSAVAVAVAAVMLFIESSYWDNIIVSRTSTLHVISVYTLLAYIFNAFASALGLWRYSSFLFALSLTAFTFTLFFTYMKNIARKNVADYTRDKTGIDSKNIFDAVSDIISESGRFSSKLEFVVEFSKRTLDFLEKGELLLINEGVSANIAVEKDGEFIEVYASENAKDELDYNSIGDVLKNSERKYTIGSSFIEMLIEAEEPVLIIFNNAYSAPESNLSNFISSLYNSVVVSYHSFRENMEMDENLSNAFINLAMITEKKSKGTGTHLFVVAKITELIAREMGYGKDCEIIGKASILHDIGKITISREILNKKGALSPEERELMRQHVLSGYNLFEGLKGKLFSIARNITLEHHENFDGSGYLGKKGEEISIYARIVRVADVFDALVSKREYKEKWSYEDAIEYIYEHRGAEFDPEVVNAFMSCGMEIIDVKENESQFALQNIGVGRLDYSAALKQ